MSRHRLALLRPNGIEIWIGWDRPLATYFAQVLSPDGDDEEATYLWVGTSREEITNARAVIDMVRPYAEIPDDLYHTLCADAGHEGERRPPLTVERLITALLRR